MNKLHKRYIEMYENSRAVLLKDCYERYSSKKVEAYKRCLDLLNARYPRRWYNIRIISYNTFHFTVGAAVIDPDTAEVATLVIITKQKLIEIPYEVPNND